MAKLGEVFGVSADPVLSYIERANIDNTFKDSLSANKHIVVYGASKQGKTALVSRHLPYDKNVVVRLSPNTNVEDIYASILRQCGVEIETGSLEDSGRELSASVGIRAKAKIWLLGEGEAEAGGEVKGTRNTQREYKSVPFNLSVAQDISELLREVKFSKKVILENFHYLDEDKQRQLSFDLRSFQELSIIFVVLGVWRQKDRLRTFCPDLTDRVIDVAVEPWDSADFVRVAAKGGDELGVEFSADILRSCIDNSFGSIGVFQELLKQICVSAGIIETVGGRVRLDDGGLVAMAVSEKSAQYSATHLQALELIAAGNVTYSKEKEKQPLYLPYYLVCAILDAGYDGFLGGMDRGDVMGKIRASHHRKDDVRPSDMTNLLHNLSSLQHKKGINPPLIDYDVGKRRLYAIDSTFFFFLKNCDLTALKEEIPCPVDSAEAR